MNWNPPLTNISSVQSFAVSPNNIAYAYGRFSFNNDPLQQRLAALGGANASITLYDLSADEQALSEPGVISTLVVDGVTLYAAGQFDILQGLPRGGLAAISSDSGAVVPWNPTVGVTDLFPGSGVATIYAGADFVYIGGNFSNVNDRLRRNFAAFPRFKLSNTFIPGNPGSVQICMPADPGAQYRIESLDQPVAVDSGHDHFGGNADFLLHRTV